MQVGAPLRRTEAVRSGEQTAQAVEQRTDRERAPLQGFGKPLQCLLAAHHLAGVVLHLGLAPDQAGSAEGDEQHRQARGQTGSVPHVSGMDAGSARRFDRRSAQACTGQQGHTAEQQDQRTRQAHADRNVDAGKAEVATQADELEQTEHAHAGDDRADQAEHEMPAPARRQHAIEDDRRPQAEQAGSEGLSDRTPVRGDGVDRTADEEPEQLQAAQAGDEDADQHLRAARSAACAQQQAE